MGSLLVAHKKRKEVLCTIVARKLSALELKVFLSANFAGCICRAVC